MPFGVMRSMGVSLMSTSSHVGLVVDLVVVGLHRHAAGAEAVVLGDQLVGDLGVLHALADLARHELADDGVRLAVGQHVAEVALPHGEAGRRVQLLEKRLALLRRHLECAARIGRVNEAGKGLLAALEHLRVVGLDPGLRLRVDRAVVQRLAPVRRALEHGEMPGGLGDLGDRLHAGGAGADHGHALAREAHRLVRPVAVWKDWPGERVHALDARQRRRRQRADGGDQKTRAVPAAVLQRHVPAPRRLLVVGGGHTAAELDVAAQVELVGDVVEIAQRLRLAGEVLRPAPFLAAAPGEKE